MAAQGEVIRIRMEAYDHSVLDQCKNQTHKRVIDIVQPTPRTIEELNKLSLPAGVDIKIRASTR